MSPLRLMAETTENRVKKSVAQVRAWQAGEWAEPCAMCRPETVASDSSKAARQRLGTSASEASDAAEMKAIVRPATVRKATALVNGNASGRGQAKNESMLDQTLVVGGQRRG